MGSGGGIRLQLHGTARVATSLEDVPLEGAAVQLAYLPAHEIFLLQAEHEQARHTSTQSAGHTGTGTGLCHSSQLLSHGSA